MGYKQRGQRDFSLLYYILYVVIVFGLLPAPLVGMIRSGKIKFNKERKNNEEIDINTALYISVPMFLFSVLFYIQFKKKENHHLINYRPVLLCKLSAICSSIYNVMLPIILAVCYHYSKEYEVINKNRHIISLSFTLVFAPMTAMANISRYVKLFLLNKRDIGRMKLYDDRHNNAYQSNFEPNDYLKRLNKLVSRQITLTIFVAPYSIILIWGAVVLYYQKHVNGSKGDDNSLITFSPVMFITTVGNLITPYIFFKLYKTLNFVNMMDLISNIVSVLVATALFVSTLFIINGKPGLSAVRSPSLFFIIPSFFTYFNAICIPLIEVYLSERKIKGKKMLNKKEFTKLLLGSRYIDSLKSTAVKCYCVETVLFWDMHMKLMKMIGEAMGKKDNHSDTNSDERVIDIKQTGMACNNISSPLPTSYELLLGLNKNIFGNDNNAIIYAGCNSNSNDLNQLTNSRPTDPRNAYKMMGQHYDDSSRDRHYNMSSGSRGRSYTGDRMGSSHGNNNNSHNNNHNNSNNNNNSNNYNYNSNSNSNGYYANDMRPTVALTNGSVKMYGQRQRNDSISQFSNNSYPSNSNGFLDSANSEKVGLLYHSEPLDLTGSRNLERGFTGYSLSNASSSTLINQNVGTGGRPYGHTRNNSLKNSNTEIFYELFNVDPNHVELPQEFWEDFRNLYFSFISDRSLATVNLDLDTINRLKKSLNNRKYTIDMFFPAISETVDLMYQNLYPKLLAK